MVILHVARVRNYSLSGADVVVPEHIKVHQTLENVGFINIENAKIDGIENQFVYTDEFKIIDLKEPFNKPDIIIFHQIYFTKYLTIAKQAKKLKIPYIIVPHGSLTREAQKIKSIKKIIGNLFFFNKFMNGASAMQYLSDDERNRSFRKYPCFVSTNGINLPSNQKENFNEDKIVFSYIGRYDTYVKGLDLLVNAIKEKEHFLRKNDCVFNFYGPYNEYYIEDINSLKDDIQRKGLLDIVSINGPVFGEEKIKTLLNTDIFIQCSRTEAMPMGILEAMSYGVPCLITKGTSLTGVIDKYDAGWSCEINVDAIANAIENAILQRRFLKQKSQNATNLIKQGFLWDNVAKEALENYKNFI